MPFLNPAKTEKDMSFFAAKKEQTDQGVELRSQLRLYRAIQQMSEAILTVQIIGMQKAGNTDMRGLRWKQKQ